MDKSETSTKTEEPEEPKTIDDYFGYDIKQTLEEIDYNMEGLSLTIVMEPHDKESSRQLKQVFEYKLSGNAEEQSEEETVKVETEQKGDEEPEGLIKEEEEEFEMVFKEEEEETDLIEKECQPDEDLIKLVERIELQHKEYEKLFNRVTKKLNELQEQYSEKDYKFSIIKRNRHSLSDTLSEYSSSSESDLSFCEEDSITSSDYSRKRKYSSEDSDSENDQKSKSQSSREYPFSADPNSDMVIIGPCGTEISRKDFESLQWKDAAGATRELCNVIFGERILATHSLTGNQSPAFRGRERPIKAQLDSDKTSDITQFICSKFKVTQQLVRATITTKCADAAKKIRRIKLKKNSIKL